MEDVVKRITIGELKSEYWTPDFSRVTIDGWINGHVFQTKLVIPNIILEKPDCGELYIIRELEDTVPNPDGKGGKG